MTTKINVLQVIPKLGYGGAETGTDDSGNGSWGSSGSGSGRHLDA